MKAEEIYHMPKPIKVAHLRRLEQQLNKEEITYSKLIEELNIIAYQFYKSKLQKERDENNKRELQMLENFKYLESKLQQERKLLEGLVRDFREVISDNDIEPQRAGYLIEAEKYLKT